MNTFDDNSRARCYYTLYIFQEVSSDTKNCECYVLNFPEKLEKNFPFHLLIV